MPIFTFYSCESKADARRQFTHRATHGELELFCFVKDAAEEYAGLFVKVDDSRVVNARFGYHNLLRSADQVPKTIDGWKAAVRAMLDGFIAEVKAMPGDADQFGFSTEEITAANRAYELRMIAAKEERQRKDDERKAAEELRVAEYVRKVSHAVIEDQSISGDDLATLANHLGVEAHPRTIGTLRRRVRAINSSSARILKGAGLSNMPYELYSSCRRRLTENA